MSTTQIEPVNVDFDITQFRLSDCHTDIINNNAIITFDQLDAASNVVGTKTIVATGTDFLSIVNIASITSFIINTEGYVPV